MLLYKKVYFLCGNCGEWAYGNKVFVEREEFTEMSLYEIYFFPIVQIEQEL